MNRLDTDEPKLIFQRITSLRFQGVCLERHEIASILGCWRMNLEKIDNSIYDFEKKPLIFVENHIKMDLLGALKNLQDTRITTRVIQFQLR